MSVWISHVLQEIRLDQAIRLFKSSVENWTLLNKNKLKNMVLGVPAQMIS